MKLSILSQQLGGRPVPAASPRPATDLLTVYLTRRQMENVFQSITEVFELRHLIGCTPQATMSPDTPTHFRVA